MATCPHGHTVLYGKRYCGDCGADMLGGVVVQTRQARSAPPRKAKRRHWRVLTWVILVWNVLMLVWIVSALASTKDACTGTHATDACRTGATAGAGIAVIVILFLAAIVDVILGIIWMVTNRRE